MNTVLVIAVLCCLAVTHAFPLRPFPITQGQGHLFCPTHGRFGAHLGFDGQLHGDRFEQLGLVGYYGNYQNMRGGGLIGPSIEGPSIGGFNDMNNFDRGFDNFDNGILGNDDIALGIGPFRRRPIPSFPIGGDDYTRGPIESAVRSTRPIGGLPRASIRSTQFGPGRGIQGGFVPRNDFDNGFNDFNDGFNNDGFGNNDLSLIHDQISH